MKISSLRLHASSNPVRLPVLLILVFWSQACSRDIENDARIIRLADPERIASVTGDGWEANRGTSSSSNGEGIIVEWDSRSSWHAFSISAEAGERLKLRGVRIPDMPLSEDGKRLIIRPRGGIAQVVPVRPNSRILLECKGAFKPPKHLSVAAVSLKANVGLPEDNQVGALNDCIRSLGQKMIFCKFAHVKGLARTVIATDAFTKALVVVVIAFKESGGILERVKMTYLDDEGTVERKATPKEPSRIQSTVSTPFLGGILRPSLLLPPRTSVRFKVLDVPDGAEFDCDMGVASGPGPSAVVTLTMKGKDGKSRELFTWQPEPSRKGWQKINVDLGFLTGQKVEFTVTCDWSVEKGARPSEPPLVCMGAPRILSNAAPRTGKGLNLILISLDTLRYDHLGCYGYDREVSPNVDRMAAEGLMFRHAYSHAPYTLPSHASLFTSLYPSVHGAEFKEQGFLPEGVPLLAEILADQGLATAAFNGGALVSHEFGFHRGYDLFCEVDPLGDRFLEGVPLNMYRLEDGASGSLPVAFSWISEMKDRPFFLFLHTFMIHDYLPPRALVSAFSKDHSGDLEVTMERVAAIREKAQSMQELTREELDFLITLYDAGIRAADEMIGELVAHLDGLGMLDQTLIVVTSDHGEEFLDHDGMFHSRTVYEELIRIPLIMRIPGLLETREVEVPVRHVDVVPTVLDLMGIAFDRDRFMGRSFAPSIAGRPFEKQPVFAEVNVPNSTKRSCVINEGWKYIEGSTDPSLHHPASSQREVYRLSSDPLENNDLSGTASRAGRALEDLMEEMRKVSEGMREKLKIDRGTSKGLSDELKELLRQQGYF